MLVSQFVFVTATICDGEAPSVICVKLGDRFGPNIHVVRSDRWKGINRGVCRNVVRKLGLGFGGAYALLIMGEMALDGSVGGGVVLGGVSVG